MQMISNEAVEAAAMASKYRKYERDYLRRINHLYFSSALPDNSGDIFEVHTIVDDFVIKESKEAPMRKFLVNSGLVNKDTTTPKVESMDVDANLPSTSSKKSQRATPDSNRKRDRNTK